MYVYAICFVAKFFHKEKVSHKIIPCHTKEIIEKGSQHVPVLSIVDC